MFTVHRPSSNDLYIVQQLINDSVSLLVYAGPEGEEEGEGDGEGDGRRSRGPGDGGGGGGDGARGRKAPGELFDSHQGMRKLRSCCLGAVMC